MLQFVQRPSDLFRCRFYLLFSGHPFQRPLQEKGQKTQHKVSLDPSGSPMKDRPHFQLALHHPEGLFNPPEVMVPRREGILKRRFRYPSRVLSYVRFPSSGGVPVRAGWSLKEAITLTIIAA